MKRRNVVKNFMKNNIASTLIRNGYATEEGRREKEQKMFKTSRKPS